jgi:hypothetical protein
MHIGAGDGRAGVVIVVTFGPGIGNAILLGGRLVPNTELGHIKIRGQEVGGGASKKSRELIPLPRAHVPVAPAPLLNKGGMVSAALAVQEHSEASDNS